MEAALALLLLLVLLLPWVGLLFPTLQEVLLPFPLQTERETERHRDMHLAPAIVAAICCCHHFLLLLQLVGLLLLHTCRARPRRERDGHQDDRLNETPGRWRGRRSPMAATKTLQQDTAATEGTTHALAAAATTTIQTQQQHLLLMLLTQEEALHPSY